MKIKIDELEKALKWIKANTNEVEIDIYMLDGKSVEMKVFDRLSNGVEIRLYSADANMMPKVRKTEIL